MAKKIVRIINIATVGPLVAATLKQRKDKSVADCLNPARCRMNLYKNLKQIADYSDKHN